MGKCYALIGWVAAILCELRDLGVSGVGGDYFLEIRVGGGGVGSTVGWLCIEKELIILHVD